MVITECAEKNIDFICTAINVHVPNGRVICLLEEKLQEIQYYLSRAYNPELVTLKQQARMHYQKWLTLKDSDKNTANAVYIEYLKLKYRISEIEIPF